MESEKKIELDMLRNVERLTEELDRRVTQGGRGVFRRYPLTFTLLALFGVVAVGEGVRGVLESVGLFQAHPWYLLLAGLCILLLTGTLYKKLDRKEVE